MGRGVARSAAIAAAVAEVGFLRGVRKVNRPADLAAHVTSQMFDPTCVECTPKR